MKTKILTIAALLLVGCEEEVSLNKFCPAECYAVKGVSNNIPSHKLDFDIQTTAGVGQCKVGVPVCDEDFNIIECDGEVLPDDGESCDGVDNDCNGQIDEDIRPKGNLLWNIQEEEPFPCHTRGVCRTIDVYCDGGAWNCDYPDTYEDGEETKCDSLDNDCDGLTDESLFENCEQWDGSKGPCTCYSGPVGSNRYPCYGGFVQCINGGINCVGENIPSKEVCDREDNDCNGIVDDTGFFLTTKYDMAFVIDRSGSMCPYIKSMITASDQYAEQFDGNENYKFAIVDMTAFAGSLTKVILNFSDFATFRKVLAEQTCNGSGYEASLDSMYEVCLYNDSSISPSLSWREDANAVLFEFTDEPEATFQNVTHDMIIDACLDNEVIPFVWGPSWLNDFEFVDEANGIKFDLVSDWKKIFDDMNSIIISLCEME